MYRERISGHWFKVMADGKGLFRTQTDSACHILIIARRLDWRLSQAEAQADLDDFAKEYNLAKI